MGGVVVGLLLFIVGVALIIIGRAGRDGQPKAFLRGSDTLEALYTIACVGCLVAGVVMSLSGLASN